MFCDRLSLILKIAVPLLCVEILLVFVFKINDEAPTKIVFKNHLMYSQEPTIYDKMKSILNCHEKPFDFEREQKGDYLIWKNYIKAGHGQLKCHESITMTINGDYRFLEHIPTLVNRWRAPISMAVFTPGTDLPKALQSIKYLLTCEPSRELIKKDVTFHIFFPKNHSPANIPMTEDFWASTNVDCNRKAPFTNVNQKDLYKNQKNLMYPINLGRNIARSAALTHFVFSNDVELFPSENVVEEFFKMVVRNSSILTGEDPRVFVLPGFEVKHNQKVPRNKTELLAMIKAKTAVPIHQYCKSLHTVPNQNEWLKTSEAKEMDLFSKAKRLDKYRAWEPFYIGTNQEPWFDERIFREGLRDKKVQNFAMCLLNYDYIVLNNPFLVHFPGIRRTTFYPKPFSATSKLIKNVIVPDIKKLYGDRKGCEV